MTEIIVSIVDNDHMNNLVRFKFLSISIFEYLNNKFWSSGLLISMVIFILLNIGIFKMF